MPPHQRSHFGASCDFSAAYGAPLDFRVHYVLPHYHELGTGFTLEIVGGPNDGMSVFGGGSRAGEPLGATLSPPVDLTGATGLRFVCSYDNPRDSVVRFGIGDKEMCVMLAFTDGPVSWVGGVTDGNMYLGDDDTGAALHEGPCQMTSLPLRL